VDQERGSDMPVTVAQGEPLARILGQNVDLRACQAEDPTEFPDERLFVMQFKKNFVGNASGLMDKVWNIEKGRWSGLPDPCLVLVLADQERLKFFKGKTQVHAVAMFRSAWREVSTVAASDNLLLHVQTLAHLAPAVAGSVSDGLGKQAYCFDGSVMVPLSGTESELSGLIEKLKNDERVIAVALKQAYRPVWRSPGQVVKALNGNGTRLSVQNVELNGQGETVAVLDSGLDNGRPDGHWNFPSKGKSGEVLVEYGEKEAVYEGAILPGADIEGAGSKVGHGTHVAGIIAHGPVDDRKGIAPWARLYIQRQGNRINHQVESGDKDFAKALAEAHAKGARVHNNSWTGDWWWAAKQEKDVWSETEEDGMQVVCRYEASAVVADQFSWQHPDFTIVAGASNRGPAPNSLGGLASAKNIITVGACQADIPSLATEAPNYKSKMQQAPQGLDPNLLSWFSSIGPTDEGRVKPDVVAAGEGILSTMSQTLDQRVGGGSGVEGALCYMDGTSMATPVASGCVALLRQWLRQVCQIQQPSSALVKALLINGAEKLTGLGWGTPGQGWGRINLENIVTPADRQVRWSDEQIPLTTGQVAEVQVEVSNSRQMKVTLVWRDPPAKEQTTRREVALVNDLDLEVVHETGTVYPGNLFDNDRTASRPLAQNEELKLDHLNNVECVILDAGSFKPGVYTVRVKARDVKQGPQPFALVISAQTKTPSEDRTLAVKLVKE